MYPWRNALRGLLFRCGWFRRGLGGWFRGPEVRVGLDPVRAHIALLRIDGKQLRARGIHGCREEFMELLHSVFSHGIAELLVFRVTCVDVGHGVVGGEGNVCAVVGSIGDRKSTRLTP